MDGLYGVAPERIFKASDLIDFSGCTVCGSGELQKLGSKSTIHPRSTFSVTLVRCRGCEHWSTSPLPTQELLVSLYGESSLSVLGEGWSDGVSSTNEVSSVASDDDWVVKSLRNSKPGKFLEIGPGSGALLRKMRSMGWDAFGVDLGDYAKGFQVVSSPNDLPADIKFDVLVFNDVLEHVTSPSDLLASYLPFLSEDAELFVGVPWSESKRAKVLKTSWEMVRPLGHLHYFSKASLGRVLDDAGFDVVSFETANIYDGYSKRLMFSIVSLAYGVLKPSRWKKIGARFGSAFDELKMFPGDPSGDQLRVKGKRRL